MAAHAAGCSFLFPSPEVKEEGKLLRQQDGQVSSGACSSHSESIWDDVLSDLITGYLNPYC